MCLTIASTFTVAWLPYQLNSLVFAYGDINHALLVQDAAKILAYLNSCLNPVVYALMWRPFRVSLIQVRLISFLLFFSLFFVLCGAWLFEKKE